MSRVNICIPTKNRGDIILNTIRSLLLQTYSDYNILVCDDKSNDDTVSKVFNLQEKTNGKVISWYTEKEGYVNTLNFILSKTTSEYICFVDSDDIVDENKIKYQVEYLDAHPDVDVVSSCVVFSDKKILVNTYVELNNDQVVAGLQKGIPMSTICHFPTCMFRRSCLEKFVNGKYFYDEYDTGMAGEGFLYTLHFLGYKFANLPTTMYLYRRGMAENSMSNNIVPEFANAINSLSYENKREYIMELFNKYNGPVEEKKPVEKKTNKKKEVKKEEPKAEEVQTEEAPKKKRGRPKKTHE